MKQHPLSAAFPSMSEDDYQALKDDIEVNGQREPVILFEGMVLDGWHRYRACTELQMPVTKFNFDEATDPVAFVKSHNLHRRHLTASQRAAAVVACSKWFPRGKPEVKCAPGAHLENQTAQKMAKEAGTGVRTIVQAKAAHKAGLGEAVRDGAMTAKEAATIASGKPIKKPAEPPVKPEPAPEDDGPSDEELQANKLAMQADAEALNKLLASDDKLAAAHAEIKRLNAELAVVKIARDGYMAKCNEQIRMIKSLQRKLDKVAA